MELLSGGEMIMRALKEEGVKMIFGYPGGAVLHIYDALYQQDSQQTSGHQAPHPALRQLMAPGFASGVISCDQAGSELTAEQCLNQSRTGQFSVQAGELLRCFAEIVAYPAHDQAE